MQKICTHILYIVIQNLQHRRIGDYKFGNSKQSCVNTVVGGLLISDFRHIVANYDGSEFTAKIETNQPPGSLNRLPFSKL